MIIIALVSTSLFKFLILWKTDGVVAKGSGSALVLKIKRYVAVALFWLQG